MVRRWERTITAGILAGALVSGAWAEASAQDSQPRIQFHGYGEAHYNNPEIGTTSQDAPSVAEVHRLAVGFTYEFTSGIRAEAEVDFEHDGEEIEVEYAYLESDLSATASLRAGSLLMPVGPLNETHEPLNYYSVERPYIERSLIPTTWNEIGIGIFGRAAGGTLGYRGYLVTGLNADGFSSMNGIRGGRDVGEEALAQDFAGVARGDWSPVSGLGVGLSGYYGGADQSQPGLGQVYVSIIGLDARYRRGGLDLRGLVARIGVDGADSVSVVTGRTIGSVMAGWSLEAAYDFLRRGTDATQRRALFAFARYEDFNTNEEVPSGFTADPDADRQIFTAGLAYEPIDKVAFKGDWEHWDYGSGSELDRFNLGVAFQFP
jgi:hypothetical protein